MGKRVRIMLFLASGVLASGSAAKAQDVEALSQQDADCFFAGCDDDDAPCAGSRTCSPADNGMPSMGEGRPVELMNNSGSDAARASKKVTPSARRPGARRSLDMRIGFELGSSELTPRGRANADIIARAMSADGASRLYTIEGHTDAIGNAAYNRRLSRDRAQAVADYLIGKGVSPERLRAVGFGFSRPLGDHAATDPANRRVEIVR